MIRVGADADLCIWDEAPAWAIERSQHLGIAGFTPYEGWQARGKPWMTLAARPGLAEPRGRARAEAGLRAIPRPHEPAAPADPPADPCAPERRRILPS